MPGRVISQILMVLIELPLRRTGPAGLGNASCISHHPSGAWALPGRPVIFQWLLSIVIHFASNPNFLFLQRRFLRLLPVLPFAGHSWEAERIWGSLPGATKGLSTLWIQAQVEQLCEKQAPPGEAEGRIQKGIFGASWHWLKPLKLCE